MTSPGKNDDASPSSFVSLKTFCLGVLVIQTCSNVLTLRYSRANHMPGEAVYISSTAIFMSEVLKMVLCIFLLIRDARYDMRMFSQKLIIEVKDNWRDGLKLSVPALLYVIQNNLLFLALSNLDAATYQVTYQLKILTTALFSVFMLSKKLNKTKWLSLVILMVGVIFVQWPTNSSSASTKSTTKGASSQVLGLTCVLLACVSSGFSGVYFEKILKGSPVSLWMRNLQLAFFSIIICTVGILFNDLSQIQEGGGFFQGYKGLVWVVVILQGTGGLIIGAVVKYADNILKGFATSISIVASGIISYYLLNDFAPSWMFLFGSTFVLSSTYMYSLPEPTPPSSMQEKV